MTGYDRWKKFQSIYEAQMNGSVMQEVCAHLMPGAPDNFQQQAYKKFFVRGSSLYFSFRKFQQDYANLPESEFVALLWKKMLIAIIEPRRTRGGGRSSLEALFVSSFCKRLGKSPTPERAKKIRVLFRAYLANSLSGVLGERQCFEKLSAIYGERVSWASEKEEKEDVDLYLDSIPISCKTLGAFSTKTFMRYRSHKKCTRPALYLNEDLRSAIPAIEGFSFFSEDNIQLAISAVIDSNSIGVR